MAGPELDESPSTDGEQGGGHQGHGHAHGVSADADAGKLAIALGLIVAFMLFEATVGLIAHSLALLSDAAHMLTDAAAIGLSLVAIRLAAKPAKGALTYGFKRVEILAAQVNGISLLVLGLLILYEAVRRLISPPGVTGGLVLAVALVGVAVNLTATWTLAKANRQSLNVEGSFQHILTDLYAFIATAIAGAVIVWTGFVRADAIASVLVAALMFRAAFGLLRDSGRVFLEAAPEGVDVQAIGEALATQPHVNQVHDLHVWEVTSGFPALSAHLIVARDAEHDPILHAAEQLLGEQFKIAHCTLQIDVDHTRGLLIHKRGCPEAAARTEPVPVTDGVTVRSDAPGSDS